MIRQYFSTKPSYLVSPQGKADCDVYKNRVLTRIYGTKSEEVTGGWRKLHTDELYDLYSTTNTGNQIKDDEMNAEHSRHGRNETYIKSGWNKQNGISG
jgi:hypothetical protein